MPRTMSDRLAIVILVIAIIGIGLSAYSLERHYKTDESTFCDIDETFNCDIVNRSIYAKFLGIPVAGIGIVGYIALLILSRINREKKLFSALLILGSLAGLGFSLYLTYVEARLLGVYCVICLASLACIVTITILAITRHLKTKQLVF
jgi:vitamin-K-epoxide reductase (warfarin-sensitive)